MNGRIEHNDWGKDGRQIGLREPIPREREHGAVVTLIAGAGVVDLDRGNVQRLHDALGHVLAVSADA